MIPLLLRVFNSIIITLINLTITLYTINRFFHTMRAHYKMMAEVAEFNDLVRQSRSSLEYISSNVSEAMKEIEDDIGKELEITRNLTKLNSKMSLMLGRFNTLEEEVIEMVRMDCNMESVKIETPIDINKEVQKVLASKKTLEPPTTPKKLRISTTTFLGTKEALQQNPISKFSAPQTSVQLIAANDNSTGPNVIPN